MFESTLPRISTIRKIGANCRGGLWPPAFIRFVPVYCGRPQAAPTYYTGCPHRCYYCFAPQVLHRDREAFHSCVEPRKGIVAELRRKLEREKITGKLVHLCFTCDPYPTGCDTTATREVIQTLTLKS